MAHPGAARATGAALLVLACLVSAATAQAPAPTAAIAPASNRTDPCYSDPSVPSCVGFRRTDEDWSADLQSLCAAMPYMVGCSMWHQCTSGEALGDSPYCSLASLTGDICVADGMQRMTGCEAYNELCASGTVVEQCLDPGVAPNVLTTFQAKASIDGVCTSHSMDGCQDCTSVGRTNFRSCPEVLNILSKLCVSMPEMEQCGEFHQFCSNTTVAAAFPKVCTQDAADGSSTSLPPMRMWFHQSAREIFLFKEWVPDSTGQYIGLCIAMCTLAVFTQFLKAVRLRVEMHWSAQMRLKCVCPESSCELAATGDPEAGSTGSGASLPSSAKLAEAPLPPCCQGGGGVGVGGGATATVVPLPLVPTSQRKPFWRSSRRGTLSCFGVDLITRDQAVRNFWRACFTFVVIFLDYALMLLVMTFNIGIILAVCGGFAIGALLFGHAGERPAVALPRAPAAPRRPRAGSSSSEEDLEAMFVEGPGCCSSGTAAAHLSSTA